MPISPICCQHYHYITHYYLTLYYIILLLYYIILYYIILYYIILYYIILYYIILLLLLLYNIIQHKIRFSCNGAVDWSTTCFCCESVLQNGDSLVIARREFRREFGIHIEGGKEAEGI